MLHDLAHFAVFAFADKQRNPDVVALIPFEPGFDGAIVHIVDRQAIGKRVEGRLIRIAICPHAIAPRPPCRRQFHVPRKIAVVCQEQQTFSVVVEPPHGNQARQIFRQSLENGRPAFRILVRRDPALGLVVTPQARRFPKRKQRAVNHDLIGWRYIQCG